MGLRVAVDIGGGFVDLVALDEGTGETFWSKSQVSENDLAECVEHVFRLSGVNPAAVSQLLHGQTLIINAILQRRGAAVGLLTTRGFRDSLSLQRSNRKDIFNLRYKKPEPFVPRERRLEVDERTTARGEILRELNPLELREVYQALLDEGVESIAICFLNSYRNPENEERAEELIRSFSNGRPVHLCTSSSISREWREYERTSTCVLNAHVMPIADNYLKRLAGDFQAQGMNATLYMMLSGGGVASFDYAARHPIETVESGPVAGVIGAVKLAEMIAEENIITLDGGSTTTKASLVQGLHLRFTTDYAVERDEYTPGYPIKVPVVDINEIGNGGGSIAWLDEVGQMKVGPLSAGAHPGPACYGWGGLSPTLTDAYLATGFLNPNNFLGGEFTIYPQLADTAIGPIARHFGISIEEAAFAIVRIGNDNAAHLLRRISIQRGFDPREFTLVAYGGSGPMMAPFLAEELEISKVVIPGIPPGNFSAWGLLMSDLKHAMVQTLVQRLDDESAVEALNHSAEALEAQIRDFFELEGVTDGISIERITDLRYCGQEHTISVPLTSGIMTREKLSQLAEKFSDYHHREYGFAMPSPVEMVNLQLTGTVRVNKPLPKLHVSPTETVAEAMVGKRPVFWGEERILTPIYRRALLPRAAELRGPAIIEEPSSTTLIPESFHALVDAMGNIVLRRRPL